MTEDKNLDIELDPEVYEVFRRSNAVSVNAGKGHALMKMTSKRRRSKQQVSLVVHHHSIGPSKLDQPKLFALTAACLLDQGGEEAGGSAPSRDRPEARPYRGA